MVLYPNPFIASIIEPLVDETDQRLHTRIYWMHLPVFLIIFSGLFERVFSSGIKLC